MRFTTCLVTAVLALILTVTASPNPQIVVTETITVTPSSSLSTITTYVTVTESSSSTKTKTKTTKPPSTSTDIVTVTKTVTKTATSSTPPITTCPIPLYYQCGGANWDGCTKCVEGAVCTSQNYFYYQCVSPITSSPSPSTSWAVTTTTSAPGNPYTVITTLDVVTVTVG